MSSAKPSPGRRVTLRDVAARLGVSPATVSNAYNRPDQLSPELRGRVLEAARADPRWSAPTIPATAYAFAALFYLAVCFSMARYAAFIERRLAAGERGRA